MKYLLFNDYLLSLEKFESVRLDVDTDLKQYPAIKSRIFLNRSDRTVIIDFPSNENGHEAFKKITQHLDEPPYNPVTQNIEGNVLDIDALVIKN